MFLKLSTHPILRCLFQEHLALRTLPCVKHKEMGIYGQSLIRLATRGQKPYLYSSLRDLGP